MKANELRIGNLVNYATEPITITASDFAVFEMYEKKKQELIRLDLLVGMILIPSVK